MIWFFRKKKRKALPREMSKVILDVQDVDNGQRPSKDVDDIIDFAFESGISAFFCHGCSKRVLEKLGRSDALLIFSADANDAASLRKGFAFFLKAAGRKSASMIVISNVVDMEDWRHRKKNGLLEGTRALAKKGLVENIAVMSYDVDLLGKMLAEEDVDCVFVPFSPRDQRANSLFSIKGVKRIVAFNPFQDGLLRDCPALQGKGFFAADSISFALSHDGFAHVLSGMNSIDDCWSQIRASEKRMGLNMMRRFSAAADAIIGKECCRGCRQCMPCDAKGWSMNIELVQRLERRFSVYQDGSAREEYQGLKVSANDCQGCSECEKRCPFGVPIIKRLKEAHRRLG